MAKSLQPLDCVVITSYSIHYTKLYESDFAIDFGDFAPHWGGAPLFNQTCEVPADYPAHVYGSRFSFFRKIRRQFDPENRMMNPFLSQYFL